MPGDRPTLPGLGQGATLTGVGPVSEGLAAALACDSTMTPTVVGSLDRDALDAMTDEWLDAHGSGHDLPAEARARLRGSLLRWAVEVLGPDGLASYLRTGLLDGPMATPSIVLDAGADGRTVPASLERLVRRR